MTFKFLGINNQFQCIPDTGQSVDGRNDCYNSQVESQSSISELEMILKTLSLELYVPAFTEQVLMTIQITLFVMSEALLYSVTGINIPTLIFEIGNI